MERSKILKDYRIYLVFAVTFVIALLFYPIEGKFKYEYQRGRPWMYESLLAPMDFPILKTDAELQAERAEKTAYVTPYYVYNKEIVESNIVVLNKLKYLLGEDNDDLLYSTIIKTAIDIYDKGVISNAESEEYKDGIIFIQKDKSTTTLPAKEVYSTRKAVLYFKDAIAEISSIEYADSLVARLNLEEAINPNLIFDPKKTEMLHKEAIEFISPTKGIIYRGQLIVSEGETITSETEQLLDSFKHEYESSLGYAGSRTLLIIGHGIVLFIILALLFCMIYFTDISIFTSFKKYLYILLMFLLIFFITVFVRDINPKFLYLVPYSVFTLYILSFFKKTSVYPIYMVILLPLLIIPQNGLELYLINLVAGAMALLSFYYLNLGWAQFVNSFFIVLVMLVIYSAFRMVKEETIFTKENMTILYLVLNGLFVIACYPFVYLFEGLFSFVSDSKLKDLSDTNKELLQEFANKAPGSFQHSLLVANLADAAIREIGGNVNLVRVGALYHDIGKINNPQCFIENKAPGIEYHEHLTPVESAREIIKHVEDGVAIAKKYKLPEVVIDFIRTHHAKSQTLYFYNSYLNSGGDPSKIDAFTYPGPLPTTKEQVVVLMADAVEASSRTLKDYSEKSISDLVNNIISARLSDSQLIDADISIKEINVAKRVFIEYLKQVYHERISYPAKTLFDDDEDIENN